MSFTSHANFRMIFFGEKLQLLLILYKKVKKIHIK